MSNETVFAVSKDKDTGVFTFEVPFSDLVRFWMSEDNDDTGNMTSNQIEAMSPEHDPAADLYVLVNKGQHVITNGEYTTAIAMSYNDACVEYVNWEKGNV